MKGNIARQRCFNHTSREAVVRCPSCHNYFCRECTSEHQGLMLCSACLLRTCTEKPLRSDTGSLRRLAWFGITFLFIWFSFYLMGRLVAAIPKSYHARSIWTFTSDDSSP